MQPDRDRATKLLAEICDGDRSVSADLFPVVYEQLRQLAGAMLRGERTDHTLQPTALVHEAYLRLVDFEQLKDDEGGARDHFVALAARAMRRILVDHARSASREKRGGGAQRITLYESMALDRGADLSALDLEAALERLEKVDPRLVQAAELRIFGGLSVREMSACMGISLTRGKVLWTSTRVMLQKLLDE